jgi:hypothetical protein
VGFRLILSNEEASLLLEDIHSDYPFSDESKLVILRNLLEKRREFPPPQKYSPDWLRSIAIEKQATWITHHVCCTCGIDVGYKINFNIVRYQSSCGCGDSLDFPSSFESICEWLEMQSSDKARDNIISSMR